MQGFEAGIHALGVGLQNGAVFGVHTGQRRFRPGAKTVAANVAVIGQGFVTDQFRQFSGSGTAQQVHLKKPLLGMQVTQCPCQVEVIIRLDTGYATVVTINNYGLVKAFELSVAFQFGSTAIQHGYRSQ